jgi:hypothetical protein
VVALTFVAVSRLAALFQVKFPLPSKLPLVLYCTCPVLPPGVVLPPLNGLFQPLLVPLNWQYVTATFLGRVSAPLLD